MGFLIRKWPLLAAVASLLVALWQIDGVRIRAALRAGPEGGAPWATAALGPASHVATIEARPIAGLDANVSGLTYSRATGTLFVVINRPPAVAELSLEGKLLRHIALPSLGDPEGITHVEGDLFIVSDEADNRLHWVLLVSDERQVQPVDATGLATDFSHQHNLGFEGVSWDESRAELLLVNEKWPRRVLAVQGLEPHRRAGPGRLDVQAWRPSSWLGLLGSDLASLTTHPQTGHLLLLSEESAIVSEYSRQGALLGLLPLWRGTAGLQATVPQPEGITVGPGGEIFIISEPNLLYRFTPNGGAQAPAEKD